MKFPLLYEINTRCWLAELSARAGRRLTLAEIPGAEFELWQRADFTHVWLMGVWTTGVRGRAWSRKFLASQGDGQSEAAVVGSPYAIQAYTVSPSLGGSAALALFRSELHRRGIKLVLDFVPNHVALDHPWARPHPEFFVTSPERHAGTTQSFRGAPWLANGFGGHGEPWRDTLQLDYRHPALRQAMREQLLAIAQQCDGVRCDMAMLVLNDVFARRWREFPSSHPVPTVEFWTEAMTAVRASHHDFLFLAEVYWDLEARLQRLSFDYAYDKRLYDRIVAHDGRGAAGYLESLPPEFISRSAHFLENHDETRIAALLSPAEHRAAACLFLGLPGLRLLHEGQLTGALRSVSVHLGRRTPELPDAEIAGLYHQMLETLSLTGVGRGQGSLLKPEPAWRENSTHRDCVIIQWSHLDGVFDLVVVNLSSARSQCFVRPTVPGLGARRWRLTDLLGPEVHDRHGTEMAERGLFLDVGPHAAQLFHVVAI